MNKLQEKRKAAGLSQSQLAALVPDLKVRTLQRYEQNVLDLNQAAAVTVYRLAQALGCRLEDLLDL